MKKDFGIVKEYDGLTGIIISGNEKIVFLNKDIVGKINVNDEVFFRKEIIGNQLRAFFVQKSLLEEKSVSRKMVKNK